MLVGLYTAYEADHTKPYTLLVGCQVQIGSAPLDGLEVREVPASTYANLACRGEHPQALINGWMKVWESDLNHRFSGDLEVYAEDFPQEAPNVDLLIALSD